MKKAIFLCTALALFAGSCKKDSAPVNTDFSEELEAIGEDVILLTYQRLDDKSTILVNLLTALENNPTVQNLEAARQAWRDTRLPWEQSEGFLFGPVDQQGIDPAIDSWPVNEVDLDNVLNSGLALTKAYIDAQEGTVKGFHTIEYLIFGGNGAKTIGDFTQREFEYLRACAQSLKGETAKLLNAWSPAGGNFVRNVVLAGDQVSIYPSQKAAIQEVVNGMIAIADEVANGKINDPFTQQNVTLEESRFSANSKADFADNIRSIRNIYFGTTDGTIGVSISRLTAEKQTGLDTKIKDQIQAAIAAIDNIPGTFTTAIFEHPAQVQNAQSSVRTLLETLQSELFPFVQGI